MYYKVIYNKRVVDVLDKLIYCKYQLKHKILLMCDKKEAQGILSSDGESAYHIAECLSFPTDIFPTVTLEEITELEYKMLRNSLLRTPDQIADELILDLINRGAL